MDDGIQVEVAYAEAEEQVVLVMDVPAGTTVGEAVTRSGILQRCPGIDLKRNIVGIYGRRVRLSHKLHAHDRVEIYRPLKVDPKEARRMRAIAVNKNRF